MKDELGEFVKGGERARMFGDNVIVYSEMNVRAIVLRAMQSVQKESDAERLCENCEEELIGLCGACADGFV